MMMARNRTDDAPLDVVSRWRAMGFLSGVPESSARYVANKLENMAWTLLREFSQDEDFDVTSAWNEFLSNFHFRRA